MARPSRTPHDSARRSSSGKSSCACPSSSTSPGSTASCVGPTKRHRLTPTILDLCEQPCRRRPARLLVRPLAARRHRHATRLHARRARYLGGHARRALQRPRRASSSEGRSSHSNGVRYQLFDLDADPAETNPQTRRAARADEDALPVLSGRTARVYVKPIPKEPTRAISDSVGQPLKEPCYAASPTVAEGARENYVPISPAGASARCRRERTALSLTRSWSAISCRP